jgi:hypothetical protein
MPDTQKTSAGKPITAQSKAVSSFPSSTCDLHRHTITHSPPYLQAEEIERSSI